MNLARQAFRISLSAYPREFRARYADEMEGVFEDRLRDASLSGVEIVREIIDVFVSALRLRLAYSPLPRPALATAIVLAMLGTVVLRGGGTVTPNRIDFKATDPAGQFTISVVNGRPIGATIDHVGIPLDRVVHRGDSIQVIGRSGKVVLAVAFYAEQGRIAWSPRPTSCRGHALDCAL